MIFVTKSFKTNDFIVLVFLLLLASFYTYKCVFKYILLERRKPSSINWSKTIIAQYIRFIDYIDICVSALLHRVFHGFIIQGAPLVRKHKKNLNISITARPNRLIFIPRIAACSRSKSIRTRLVRTFAEYHYWSQ